MGLVGLVLFFFQRKAFFVLCDDRLELWITVERWHFLPDCFYFLGTRSRINIKFNGAPQISKRLFPIPDEGVVDGQAASTERGLRKGGRLSRRFPGLLTVFSCPAEVASCGTRRPERSQRACPDPLWLEGAKRLGASPKLLEPVHHHAKLAHLNLRAAA